MPPSRNQEMRSPTRLIEWDPQRRHPQRWRGGAQPEARGPPRVAQRRLVSEGQLSGEVSGQGVSLARGRAGRREPIGLPSGCRVTLQGQLQGGRLQGVVRLQGGTVAGATAHTPPRARRREPRPGWRGAPRWNLPRDLPRSLARPRRRASAARRAARCDLPRCDLPMRDLPRDLPSRDRHLPRARARPHRARLGGRQRTRWARPR